MSAADYAVEKREVVASTGGLMVRIFTLSRGQAIPWHHHSAITDTFVCMEGTLRIQTRAPDELHLLQPGQTVAVPPGRAHLVSGPDGAPVRFLLVQGVGTYDFIADPPPGEGAAAGE